MNKTLTPLSLIACLVKFCEQHPELVNVPITEPYGIAGGVRDIKGVDFMARETERLDRPKHLVIQTII